MGCKCHGSIRRSSCNWHRLAGVGQRGRNHRLAAGEMHARGRSCGCCSAHVESSNLHAANCCCCCFCCCSQARVAGIEELKHNVEMLRLAASEADQLEVKFASLASTASRLPVLRGQVQQLQDKATEVEMLEAEIEKLKNVGVGACVGAGVGARVGGEASTSRRSLRAFLKERLQRESAKKLHQAAEMITN